MTFKGPLMISLTFAAGASFSGCRPAPYPAVAAPSSIYPGSSVPLDGPTARIDAEPASPFRLPPTLNMQSNPFKPSVAERDWQYIVLHHTAGSHGSVESIHETHLKRKDSRGNPWMGIGYHFVIGNGNGMADGDIEPTFRWHQQLHGAHAGVGAYNDRGIGICLVGNFELAPPSEAQLSAVKRLVGILKSEYGITGENVIGHGDVKATACPGRYFPLAEIGFGESDTWLGQRPRGTSSQLIAHEGTRLP